MRTASPEWYEKFMSKVSRSNVVRDCWIWTGGKNQHGYGIFCHGGKAHKAYRFAFAKFHGDYIPPGLSVLHGCDNPACVNPLHLRLGTQQENNADRDVRNRVRHGDKHPWSKLTASQVREMRMEVGDLTAFIAKLHEFAARYGVDQLAIYKALTHQTWRRA